MHGAWRCRRCGPRTLCVCTDGNTRYGDVVRKQDMRAAVQCPGVHRWHGKKVNTM